MMWKNASDEALLNAACDWKNWNDDSFMVEVYSRIKQNHLFFDAFNDGLKRIGVNGTDFKTCAKTVWERVREEPTFTTMIDGKATTLPRLKTISAYDLVHSDLPPIYYPVEGLIPEGETIIAAPPKSGKSWFVLDMGLKVAAGLPFLGFNTRKSGVLYLALEDGDKFEQERLLVQCPNKEAIPQNFHLVFDKVKPLDDGFLEQLNDIYSLIGDLKMVIVDTLSFIAYRQKKGESAYSCDYRTGRALKEWGDQHGVAVVVVTHTTKLVHPDDALANVSGTNGTTGAADAVLVIAKEKRTDADAVLAVDGRRVRQAEKSIRMDWDKCTWEYLGEGGEPEDRERAKLRASTMYKAILAVTDHYIDGWKGTARELITEAAKLNIFVLESPKEMGGCLCSNIPLLASDGVRVEIIKRGTASRIYKLSAWERMKE